MTLPYDGGLEGLRDALGAYAAAAGRLLDLDCFCEFAGRHLDAAVALSFLGGRSEAAVVAGDLARLAEELQLTVGEGPSGYGFSALGILAVDDLNTAEQQTRWPLFAPAAVEAGVRSLCAVPMRVGAARFGVFVAYFDRPSAVNVSALTDSVLLSAIALDLLLDRLGPTTAGGSAAEKASGMAERIVGDRPEIHQATGMVSAQAHVDLPTALLYLRGRAFADGRVLSELAADVVAGAIRFDAPAAEPP
ncbi:MAG: ANTAR domain-containing protein [Sporichthyaceae bacterium]